LRRLLFVSESIFKSTLEMMNDSAAIFGIAKYTHNMVERPFWCLNLRYPGFKEASVDFKYDVAVWCRVMQGGPSGTCDEGEHEEKSEERRWEEGQAMPFYTWFPPRKWDLAGLVGPSVASSNAYTGLSDSTSSQTKTVPGSVTEYAGDLGGSSISGV
jgi:hypothetical protein